MKDQFDFAIEKGFVDTSRAAQNDTSLPDKPSTGKSSHFQQQFVISEGNENKLNSSVEGIDQVVSENNTKKAANIRRSESDGVVRTYVRRQSSTSKYEKKYILRKKSKRQNITDSEVQTHQPSVSMYPEGTGKQHSTLLERHSSDSMLTGLLRDRRRILRDKWRREQQMRKFNQQQLIAMHNDNKQQMVVNSVKRTQYINPNESPRNYMTTDLYQIMPSHRQNSSPRSKYMSRSPRYNISKSHGYNSTGSSRKPVVMYTEDGEPVLYMRSQHSFGRKKTKGECYYIYVYHTGSS